MAKFSTILGCLFLFLYVVSPGAATIYTVDWSLGTDYSSWATGKTFAVGDTITFNYGAGHTVDEVSGSDYQGCTVGNAITTDSSGTTSIPLKTPGTHYFICGSAGHCTGGMKLAVTVAASSSGGGGGGTATPTPSAGGGSNSPTTTTTTNTPSSVYKPASTSASGALTQFTAFIVTLVVSLSVLAVS